MSIELNQPAKDIHPDFIKASNLIFITTGLSIINFVIPFLDTMEFSSFDLYVLFREIVVFLTIAYLLRKENKWAILLLYISIIYIILFFLFGPSIRPSFIFIVPELSQLILIVFSILLVIKGKIISMETTAETTPTKYNKSSLIKLNIFAVLVSIFSAFIAFVMAMGGLGGSNVSIILMQAFISVPILTIISLSSSWIFYSIRRYQWARWAGLSPILEFILIVIFGLIILPLVERLLS